jgi:NAD dependent epimerase/dehydratase
MRILVTGAGGFIGSHLTEKLLQQGHEVTAFVHYNSFNTWGWLSSEVVERYPNLKIFSGDIRDPHGVITAMTGCDAVLHLASLIAIPFSYHSPDTYVETNIRGTLNVMQAAKSLAVQRVIHTSTSEVYGTARYVPIDEAHPQLGQSPYSASKIGADQIAYSFYSSFGLPVVIIRPFNTYGPRQSLRAVIPTIITQILSNSKKISLGDIRPTRDFSFVSDTVNGFVCALNSENGIGEVINLGSGYETSIAEVTKLIAAILNVPINIEIEELRKRPEKSEVTRLLANNQKARYILDWAPEFEGLDGLKLGLHKTIEWFQDSQNIALYKPNIYNL